MASLFEQDRTYVLGDPELEILGDREKLAQWRHKGLGPAYYKLGRKVVYRGADLNAWAELNRFEPCADVFSPPLGKLSDEFKRDAVAQIKERG